MDTLTTVTPVRAPLRRPVVTVSAIVAAVAVVAVLGVHFAGERRAGSLDRDISTWLRGQGISATWATRVSDIGDPEPVIVMIAVLVVALIAIRKWQLALLALIAPVLAVGITELVLKPIVDRTHHGSLSYPSGHTTAVAAIALVIALALFDRRSPRIPISIAVVISVLLLAGVGCVAAALVISDRHYATDTIGGAGVALATVLSVALVVDRLISPRR